MADAEKKPEDETSEEEKKPAPAVAKTARDMMIPLSHSAEAEWRDDREGFAKHAQEVASGLYPTLAPQISAGHTVKTLLDPYVQVAKGVLGDDVEPNWTDPKWTKALEGGIDPATKRPTLMPLTAWKTYLQTEPAFGFDKSPVAHQRAEGFAAALHASFGGKV